MAALKVREYTQIHLGISYFGESNLHNSNSQVKLKSSVNIKAHKASLSKQK